MQGFLNAVTGIANESGFVGIMENPGYLIMIIVACGLIYLAIGKQFEPLLLLPIAFGMLLANLPFGEIIHMQYFIPPEGADPSLYPMFSEILHHGGLADMLYLGVKLGIYPPLIFLGIGTMTDFGPLISNPKSLLLGAAAQLGIFTTYIGAKLLGFTEELERTNYTQAVSREYSIPYDDLRKLVNSMAMKGGIVKPQTKLKSGINEKNKKEDGMKQSQKLLLTWLIEDNSLFDRIKGRISADDFTEELYHKVAKEVFSQYETTHTVNPARIVSMFTDEDEQREVAGLFNATIHQVEGKNDKATALRETVVRIKQNSIDYRSKHLAPTDMEGMMRIIEDKRALEELQKIPE